MKVLHVAGPNSGGISRHIEQLRQGMAALGVQSRLAPPARVGPGAVAAVLRELRRDRYDLVHCHGFQGGAVGRAAALAAGVPALVTIHNTLQAGGATGRLALAAEKFLRSGTSCWVAVSVFLRNYAWRVLKVPAVKLHVIANGVEIPPRLLPWQPRPVVGVVARLIPAKGVDVFLRAIQLLRPEIPELRAMVVGDGPARQQLEFLAQDLGIDGVVEFLGHRRDVPELLQKMGVFVLPTRSEGLGLSILEAMAMGVPVAAAAVGGVPELVRHQRTGLLVEAGDAYALARAVRRLLHDREKTEAMRRAAYEFAAARHDVRTMVAETLAVYRRVADG
ncbi:MAG: glycosyltransferase family 4 protein [Firmicutes bacterium]|nr:glycosyltransferase family 4 protein [Bacillota bacterium]HOB34713.1 glycosyltransferase family 4 protein [Bacillota bacterium]HPZ90249.1 glycosyltransferase family 4 protein [Bacillota bacterium]HQE01639.1 glycosyltransferase family 4 protein [Bacillota bacterium]